MKVSVKSPVWLTFTIVQSALVGYVFLVWYAMHVQDAELNQLVSGAVVLAIESLWFLRNVTIERVTAGPVSIETESDHDHSEDGLREDSEPPL